MPNSIEIIDGHMHLIDYESNPYPWLAKEAPRPKVFGPHEQKLFHNYLVDDYKADVVRQHVVKSVHVQAGWDANDPVGETRWLESIHDTDGFPHAIVAFANLAADDVEAVLEAHRQSPKLRGIRHILNWRPADAKSNFGIWVDRDYLTDAKWRRGFALLEKYGLSFDLQIFYNQMPAALELAQSFPSISIILDHTGMPLERTPEELHNWAAGMATLAQAPNVAVKISGLGVANPEWTVDSIRPIVLRTIELFGIERCFFASNFPVDRLFSSYDTLVEAYQTILQDFSLSERQQFFNENAARLYRL